METTNQLLGSGLVIVTALIFIYGLNWPGILVPKQRTEIQISTRTHTFFFKGTVILSSRFGDFWLSWEPFSSMWNMIIFSRQWAWPPLSYGLLYS